MALSQGHVRTLDGLRGVAILLVLAFHLYRPPYSSSLVVVSVDHLLAMGWLGVDLFFVLSGFLITGILLDTREQPGALRTFWVRPALRILPLYYAFLVFCLFALPRISVTGLEWSRALADVQWWFWLHGSNLLQAVHGRAVAPDFVDGFWSLAIEEQFYLVWPFVVHATSRRTLARVAAAGVVGAPLVRAAILTYDPDTAAAFMLPFARLDGLTMGTLLALWAREPAGLDARRGVLALGAAAGLAALVLTVVIAHKVVPESVPGQIFGISGATLVFAALVARAVTARPGSALHAALTVRPLVFLGAYSYGIYVVHVLVALSLDELGVDTPHLMRLGLSVGTAMAAVALLKVSAAVATALVTWHVIEQPCLRLKRFATYGRAIA